MAKKKRYIKIEGHAVELHESPHISVRPLDKSDIKPNGEYHLPDQGKVSFVLASGIRKAGSIQNAKAIPVSYPASSGDTVSSLIPVLEIGYGRWHINTDQKGMKYTLPDGKSATTQLYWTRPVYVYFSDQLVFQGTQKWFPSKNNQYPADLSDVEKAEAYNILLAAAQRQIREMSERGEDIRFHLWRQKQAERGLKRLRIM